MEGPDPRISEAAIIARARAMLPELRRRAGEIEALRRLPDDLSRAFAAAGFYKIMQPRRYGGYELEFGTQTELGCELGRACGSAAWVATVISCHPWIAGMFPKEAQDEIWGASADTMLASSFLPVAPQAERVAGGYRVSGRWKFSSGVDQCQWAVVMLPLDGKVYFALLPLDRCRIEDTWHAIGLGGTGSNDIVADQVFTPAHRLLDTDLVKGGGPSPGSAVNDHYLYRLPVLAPLTFSLIGNALGLARGIYDDVVEGLAGQTSRSGPVAANQSIQLRVAEASAEIEAAHALVFAGRDDIVRKGKAGAPFALADRVRYRRDLSYAGQLCLRAVERLFPILGGRGLMTDHPVQRGWRDLHAVTHHLALTWDIQGSTYGAVALGLPCPDARI